MNLFDIVVIGGGAAGISASIQLKRFGFEPILIEKEKLGGALLNANLVENYPGFPYGITGHDLAGLITKQFRLNKIKTIFSEVKSASKNNNYFEIKLGKKNRLIYARSLIVATGAVPKRLKLQNEDKLHDSGKLFYEIEEVPPNIKGKKFVIIGGGDAAFDYALNLADKNNLVTIVCRNNPKCLDVLFQRVKSNEKIKVLTNSVIKKFWCDKNKVYLTKNGTGNNKDNNNLIECDYVIAAIGKKANTNIIYPTAKQTIKTTKTIGGLFIIGDANNRNKIYRQLGIAVGEGLLAAIKVKNYTHGQE